MVRMGLQLRKPGFPPFPGQARSTGSLLPGTYGDLACMMSHMQQPLRLSCIILGFRCALWCVKCVSRGRSMWLGLQGRAREVWCGLCALKHQMGEVKVVSFLCTLSEGLVSCFSVRLAEPSHLPE